MSNEANERELILRGIFITIKQVAINCFWTGFIILFVVMFMISLNAIIMYAFHISNLYRPYNFSNLDKASFIISPICLAASSWIFRLPMKKYFLKEGKRFLKKSNFY